MTAVYRGRGTLWAMRSSLIVASCFAFLPVPQAFGDDPGQPRIQSRWRDPALSDPNATELDRTEALIRSRILYGEDHEPHCEFGPITVRISVERLKFLMAEFKKRPGEELWKALLAEPQDPNQPPMDLVVSADNGPKCREDEDKALLEERGRLIEALPNRSERRPVWWNERASNLEQIDFAMRSRARADDTHDPGCWFGPVKRHVRDERLLFLFELFDRRPGDELMTALAWERDDPSLPAVELRFPVQDLPSCAKRDTQE